MAALLCALLGALGSVGINRHTFWPLFADWFGEQFSTGVLIVPCMLTVRMPPCKQLRYTERLLPIVALIISVAASVVIGGAGGGIPSARAHLVCGALFLACDLRTC